ncbi:hypothetical protein CEP54_014154 [Fusarium duplospermum]|uniref:Uncharacterized protein n=1 Tax=Fusarium duplospermum TaxID=1325734 RepID=A0A428NY55_9HYPO|nr:hypothetical protein CEP54_014154 [Fusarium duplospermum]
MYKIEIMLPREGFSRSVEPAGDALRSRFPGPKHLSVVEALEKYQDALCHLTKEAFKLDLYDSWGDKRKSGEWGAKVVDHP